MRIRNHRLQGIPQEETPNRGGVMEPKLSGVSLHCRPKRQESIDWLCNPKAKASAHLVVGRDGSIAQLVPFNIKAWHAGVSHWDGITGLNSCSIGIEMDNAADSPGSAHISAWFQAEYPEEVVIQARHKFEQDLSYWHTYTEEQIQNALELACFSQKPMD